MKFRKCKLLFALLILLILYTDLTTEHLAFELASYKFTVDQLFRLK